MLHRPATTILVLLAALSALVACTSSPTTKRVATDAVFPPFHFVDDSGALAGYDVAVARSALSRAGMEAELVHAASYAALFTGLREGEHDVVAATTGITPERRERYGFTRPYFVTCLAVIVRAGPGEPTMPVGLAGRPVAASAGTTSAMAAHRIDDATVIETSRWRDSLAALRAGQVDAVVIDEFEAVPFARAADDLEVLPTPIATEQYGLVVRLDDDELRRRLDAALAEMESDGSLGRLRSRFGLDRPDDWPVLLPE